MPPVGHPKILMPLWNPLVAAAGLGAIGLLGGSAMESSAASSASEAQAKAAQNALDFAKGVYDQRYANLSPYRSAGNASLSQARSLLGIPDTTPKPQGPPGSTPNPGYIPGQSVMTPTGKQNTDPSSVQYYSPIAPKDQMPSPGSGATQMVQMQAPNGEIQMVPNTMVDFYRSKGATIHPL